MHPQPDHRFRLAQAAVKQQAAGPEDPETAALVELLAGRPCPLPNVAYAYDLFRVDEHRPILDAFLLTRSAPVDISGVLEIDHEVIGTYSRLFMDVAVFRNRLEIISFASEYEASPYGKEIVKAAVQAGPEYLYWAYGKPNATYDPREIIRRTMIDSFFRGMAHKGNALTTQTAKEAHKWWATAVKNAELSERLNPSTTKLAAEELRIALAQRDDTVQPEAFEVPLSEILH
jgi:hypothetical protein